MAAAIPVYARRFVEQPGMQGAHAQGVESPVDPVAQGLASLASAVGQGANRLLEQERQQSENRAAVDVANVLSQGDTYWQTQFAERAKAWKVGDPDLRDGLGKDFEKWRTEAASKLPTEASRTYFQQHTASMGSRLQTGAYTYQEKSTTAKLNADSAVGQQDDENAVYHDPARFDDIYRRRMEPMLARTDLSEAEKIKGAQEYKSKLSLAVEKGEMERDPAGWYAKRFGQYQRPGTPAAAGGGTPVVSAPAASIAQAIYGQESSGGKADTSAVNSQNVTGPMQMQEGTFEGMKKLGLIPQSADWKNPQDNKDAGFKWVEHLSKKYDGDAEKVAAAYYGGEKAVRPDGTINRAMRNQKRPGDPTVGEYIDQVTARMSRQGGQGYSVASASTGTVSDAGNGMPAIGAPAAKPEQPKTFTSMDWEQQSALRTAAETRIRQGEAILRTDMEVKLRDAAALHADGKADSFNLSREQFNAAFGAEGPRKFDDYQQSRAMGQDIGKYKTMTPAEMQVAVEADKSAVDALASAGGYGYQTADARHNIRVAAAKSVIEAQQKDPQLYARTTGLAQTQPLDMQDMQKFGAEMTKRGAVASMMQDKYRTPNRLLTADEATQLSTAMQRFPAAARVEYLSTLRKSVTDPTAYRSVLQQIAPDSPVTAVAGSILAKEQGLTIPGGMFRSDVTMNPRAVATTILAGEAILNPTKGDKKTDGRGGDFPMPKDAEMETEFASYVGKSFRGDATGYSAAYQAYRAYYAGKASEKGVLDKALDSKISREALASVTGGVTDFNGNGEVLKPWGMPDGAFKDAVQAQFGAVMDANGFKGTRMDNLSAYGLQALRENQYLLTNGAGYLLGKDGQPVVIDTSAPAAQRKAAPAGPAPADATPVLKAPPIGTPQSGFGGFR